MMLKGLGELAMMTRTYRARGYPPFVYADGDSAKYLPVFFFHEIGAEIFGRDLDYLADNGYATLTCEDIRSRSCFGVTRTRYRATPRQTSRFSPRPTCRSKYCLATRGQTAWPEM